MSFALRIACLMLATVVFVGGVGILSLLSWGMIGFPKFFCQIGATTAFAVWIASVHSIASYRRERITRSRR